MFDLQVPQNHTNFGDVLVVLNQSREFGVEQIPNGNILIEVKQDGETLATTHISDNDGVFEYTLLYGKYEVVASFRDENDEQWNCWGAINVDETQQTLVVPCYDRQYNFMPYTAR